MNAPPIAPANPFFDLSLVPGSDSTGRQPRAGHGYILRVGHQDPRAGRYLRELSRKYCKNPHILVLLRNKN